MKTNVALIGFMGTGKTAVGQLLSRKLKKQFIELDRLIEQRAGKSIPEIFKEQGEIAFRELEIEATREAAARQNAVIACGGGVVLNRINIDRLRESSKIVYLTASPGTILARTSNTGDERPLLNVHDQALRIRELLKFRRPFYERAADITVNTTKLDIESVAEKIIDRLKEDEDINF
jgi:shikimate kinase